MAASDHIKRTLSLNLTSTLATCIGGFVLYKLWSKFTDPNTNVVIQSLHIYPIKSCRGFEVNRWPISKYGLKYDRAWMIYNPKTKRFSTQRELHVLALIQVDLIPDGHNTENVRGLRLSAPHMPSIIVPIQADESDANTVDNITLWRDKVSGIDQGDGIAKWLTKYINNGREYRLLHIPSSDYKRATNPKYTPAHLVGQSHASYADGYPYLIASQASLNNVNETLNKRGLRRIAMNRFRPNIVITTDSNEAFIEDRIETLTLTTDKDTIHLYVTHPCSRCQMPTIDQESGVANKEHEPTKTLRTYRTGKHLGFDQSEHGNVFFGMNAVHDNFDGSIIVSKGDVLLPVFKK
eukprot:1082072_1